MQTLQIRTSESWGPVPPMHAVNNGPVYKFAADQRVTNIEAWRDACIPFARNHDASFYATYGGEHTVDVNFIFPNFDADPEDPASYDFAMTDEYLRVIAAGNTRVFYRLGSKIEHGIKKYNTLPPRDFKKWAVICEHIIRHYTEGWADGFRMDIPYWEIWNEPDLDPDDSRNKRTWGGTKAQFFDLYAVTARHLKSCFPELKIGGPALAHDEQWAEDFLREMQARQVAIDFFSWHIYSSETAPVLQRAERIRTLLDRYGYQNAESILNEWNYVCGWTGDEWIETKRVEKGLKGSSFIAAVMSSCYHSPVDMLMYYDARPCGMNGMFDTDFPCDCLKGYYPFRMYADLWRLPGALDVSGCGEGIYACAAAGDDTVAVMLTCYQDRADFTEKTVRLQTGDLGWEGIRAEYYLLDADHDRAKVGEALLSGGRFDAELTVPLYGTYEVLLRRA